MPPICSSQPQAQARPPAHRRRRPRRNGVPTGRRVRQAQPRPGSLPLWPPSQIPCRCRSHPAASFGVRRRLAARPLPRWLPGKDLIGHESQCPASVPSRPHHHRPNRKRQILARNHVVRWEAMRVRTTAGLSTALRPSDGCGPRKRGYPERFPQPRERVQGKRGTLLNNWNKLDWRLCNPLAMNVLERFAWWKINIRSPSDLFQHSV